MIADQETRGALASQRRSGEHLLQDVITFRQAVMGQVAGDDDPVGVGLVLFHMREALPEILDRIEIEDALGIDVDVGNMNDFHALARSGKFAVP